jgi:hypothetical protein
MVIAYSETKKADVTEHPEVFDHVGLLIDGPSSYAGLPFIQSSDYHISIVQPHRFLLSSVVCLDHCPTINLQRKPNLDIISGLFFLENDRDRAPLLRLLRRNDFVLVLARQVVEPMVEPADEDVGGDDSCQAPGAEVGREPDGGKRFMTRPCRLQRLSAVRRR